MISRMAGLPRIPPAHPEVWPRIVAKLVSSWPDVQRSRVLQTGSGAVFSQVVKKVRETRLHMIAGHKVSIKKTDKSVG